MGKSSLDFIEAVHIWQWKVPLHQTPLANERNYFLFSNQNMIPEDKNNTVTQSLS